MPIPVGPVNDERRDAPARHPVQEALETLELGVAGHEARRGGAAPGSPDAERSAVANVSTVSARWIDVQQLAQRVPTDVELAPDGVMATFGREDLDDQAMRGLVGRVAIEQLVGDRACLVGPSELERPPPGDDRHAAASWA